MPAVTFILPMYRGEATLQGCLASLRDQRFRDWECIGVDDASPDRSAEIFAAAAAGDGRLQLVRHPSNQGVGAARATGLARAQGFAVHLLDQDDHLNPEGVRLALRALRRDDSTPAVYGNFVATDTRTGHRRVYDEMPPSMDFRALLHGPQFCPIAVLHRRSTMEAAGGCTPGFDNCDDWDLWARMARLGPALRHVPHVLGEWRIHAENNSRVTLRTFSSGLEVLERMHGPDPRVATPSPAWAAGADLGGKAERVLSFFWLQVANRVAHRDSDGALALAQEYVRRFGSEALPVSSITHLDAAMPSARALAGESGSTYVVDLYEFLEALLADLERLLGQPGFALGAMRALSQEHVRRLAATNERLASAVESYRTSRSYRIGRKIMSLANALTLRRQ